MILLLLFIFPFVYSTKSSENDLLSLETGYQKPTYEPTTGYYSPPVPYNSYEQEPQLDYINHPYPQHETPKSDYISNYYKSSPKTMSYPPPEPHYKSSYSSPSNPYPASSYGYSASPPKMYDSYKMPKKYSHSYSSPIYHSEYLKYKPNKKVYKMSHSPPSPHPSSVYPIDEYYQYKAPEKYSSYPPPKQSYAYPYKAEPYQPEYKGYSSPKAYSPPTYVDYPKQSYESNYSPPSQYYPYEPKSEYPTSYEEEPYYSSNSYPQKY